MPWAVIAMLGILWLYIKYFSGSWVPVSTREFRILNFRNVRLSGTTWLLGIIGALLIVLIEQSGLVVTFRFMEFPADRFVEEYGFLQNVPLWAAWAVIIMISVVAGICEETGFRGYMQVPLENKYGPVAAIGIVSVVFVLVHLHQAWSGPILLHIFFISVLFGTIAYFTGSLIPGIIGHIIMDIFNFSFWWSDLGQQFDKQPMSISGIDPHFIIWSLIFILAICAYLILLSRLNKRRIKG
jgi:membrane protease YdiL (CAAX protease family)